MTSRPARPLLVLGILALAGGIWAGLLRIGWTAPALPLSVSLAHGPLMVSGFLGTLIGVERAIAVRRAWAFGGPALTGVGSVILLLGVPSPIPAVLMSVGAAVLVGVFLVLLARHPTLAVASMFLGAVAWLVGNEAWALGRPLSLAALWWVAFLVLTVAGERLELSQIAPSGTKSRPAFGLAAGVLMVGALVSGADFEIGPRLFGLGAGLVAAWLLANDIAWRAVRTRGLPRFIAIALLAGYAWLAFAGGTWLVTGAATGAMYDVALHAVFLGFVFSMVIAHAPIIFPSVLGIPVPFRGGFYVHLVALHLSLAIRVAGDLGGWPDVRRWGGALNALAIVMFLAATMASAILARRVPSQPS